ncbi:MAG: WS/DGAT domain-containing protein, partial [Gammaproteobacteria bacterium]
PQHPMYLAGARMREIMFWVPQNGSIGIGISILSYDGQVFFGLISDRKRVPEPNRVVQRFPEQFEQYTYLSLLLSPNGALPPMEAASRVVNGEAD